MFDHLGSPPASARAAATTNATSSIRFFGLLTRPRLVLAAQIADFLVIITVAMLVIR
jgi:hypothetical protein